MIRTMKRAGQDDKKNQIHVTILSTILHKYKIEIQILDCEANLTKKK